MHSGSCRATQRADYPPHLLALHKLGWLAETRVRLLFSLLNLLFPPERSPHSREVLLLRHPDGASRPTFVPPAV
jgi:hypothetical protein